MQSCNQRVIPLHSIITRRETEQRAHTHLQWGTPLFVPTHPLLYRAGMLRRTLSLVRLAPLSLQTGPRPTTALVVSALRRVRLRPVVCLVYAVYPPTVPSSHEHASRASRQGHVLWSCHLVQPLSHEHTCHGRACSSGGLIAHHRFHESIDILIFWL